MINYSRVVNRFVITTGKQIHDQVVKKFIDIHTDLGLSDEEFRVDISNALEKWLGSKGFA